jgi:hypothetical protein
VSAYMTVKPSAAPAGRRRGKVLDPDRLVEAAPGQAERGQHTTVETTTTPCTTGRS